jgi:carbon storage regulator
MIGDDIEITVVDIRGDKVRLGINAPTRIAVHRKEVYESIRRENEQAARLAGSDLVSLPPISLGPARTRTRVSGLAAGAPVTDPARSPSASARTTALGTVRRA